jgi:site-specific recombinase XerC
MAMSFVAQVNDKVARNKEGSGLTHKARQTQLKDAAKIIEKEYRLKDLNNLKLKHVQHVISTWKDSGISPATMKNRVGNLRWLCKKIGKQNMLPRDNKSLGLESRIINYNTDKGWAPSKDLKSELPDAQRLHIELMRNFGMRFQEAAKFKPEENARDNLIHVVYGTKGGRDRDLEFVREKNIGEERTFSLTYEKQHQVLAELKDFLKDNRVESLSRMHEKYKNFVNNTRYVHKESGITKEGVGTSHGLRHKYAQDRYQQMTGWKPPAQLSLEERKAFRASMTPEMRETDRAARSAISEELGHGRRQVSSNYVGSWKN